MEDEGSYTYLFLAKMAMAIIGFKAQRQRFLDGKRYISTQTVARYFQYLTVVQIFFVQEVELFTESVGIGIWEDCIIPRVVIVVITAPMTGVVILIVGWLILILF